NNEVTQTDSSCFVGLLLEVRFSLACAAKHTRNDGPPSSELYNFFSRPLEYFFCVERTPVRVITNLQGPRVPDHAGCRRDIRVRALNARFREGGKIGCNG